MWDIVERLLWLLSGGVIGFVIGYMRRDLQEIKEELDEVDQIVKNEYGYPDDEAPRRPHDERGLARYPVALDVALLVVVLITAWAAIMSQKASNDLRSTQDEIGKIALCNQQYLKAQAEFLDVLLEDDPPATRAESSAALRKYYALLSAYANSSTDSLRDFTFPLSEETKLCLATKPGAFDD